MLEKKILFGSEARQKLAKGADTVARAVVSTLGPRSRNVAYFENTYYPKVIHDGVSVARQIFLKDKFENLGAQLIKDAAGRTNDMAGDGTTTATLLANTLIQEGMNIVEGLMRDGVIREKVNPMELREKLKEYADLIVAELDKMAKKIETIDEKRSVATVSAQDEKIGDIVTKAIEKVGDEGIIMVEESSGFEDTLDFQEGMEFDNGYLSAYFFTDPNRFTTNYKDGYILLASVNISSPDEIVPIIEKVHKAGNKPLIIIADDVTGPALTAMVMTKLKAGYPLVAVKAPEYGERRLEMLEDIAILTGGVVINPQTKPLKDVEIKDLGRFRKIEVSATDTKITPAHPDSEEIQERLKVIREQIANEANDFKKERLQYRLAKLSQGVAIIQVGGGGEAEIKEKTEKYRDSISALKAALSEGVVPGGGLALLKVLSIIAPKEENPTWSLVEKMLMAPAETILKNSGIPFSADFIHVDKDEDKWIDVMTGQKVNMIEKGIIDPVKVTKLAVRHAISVASLLLTTETLIVEEDEEKK